MSPLYVEISFPIPVENSFTYSIPQNLQNKITIGQRVFAPFHNQIKIGFVVNVFSKINDKLKSKIKPIIKILDYIPFLTPELMTLAKWMKEYYFSSYGEALATIFPSSYAGKLEQKQTADFKTKQPVNMHQLTDEQQKNFNIIYKSIKKGIFSSYLLYGVTGSGKTEIYTHLIKSVLESDKTVIFLLPEISLSTQIVQYFLRVFDSKSISILHSRMTQKQKIVEWQKILHKERRIVIGPRSALFAPLHNLGLIIIDEEHSSTYKEHARPKYSARQVAYFRAKMNSSVLLLGSATPSLESFYLAKTNFFKLLTLSNRINNTSLPEISIIKNNSFQNILHPLLVEKINEKIKKREQVIIFYNHRGFSNFYYCADCGYIVKCPHCSVSLTYHRKENKNELQCHFCGHIQEIPAQCPECNSNKMSPVGVGTQKIELILKKYFPDAVIQRYDFDATKRKGSSEKIYNDFIQQKIDILVGTQMVAKGLHFPNVTLVGVVGFDNMVNLPDFRSFENTFSTLIQVAGRTGRADKSGEVIIQTIDEKHPLVLFMKNHDYDFFYEHEIKNRQMLLYPPFSRLIRILVRSRNEKKARLTINEIGDYLRNMKEDMKILGPVSAPYGKLHNRYRFHIVLKLPKRKENIDKKIKKIIPLFSSSNINIDVEADPISLL